MKLQLLSSVVLPSIPLTSVFHNNKIYTNIDNYSTVVTDCTHDGAITTYNCYEEKPLITTLESSKYGLLIQRRSQPIQLKKDINDEKSIISYNPLPENRAILLSLQDSFVAFHSSQLFEYKYDYFESQKSERIKGLVSDMTYNGNSNTIITSCYNGLITVYSSKFEQLQSMKLDKEINQIESYQDNYIIIGTRKDDKIYIFDLRSFESPVALLTRNAASNQKISFAIKDTTLYTGNIDGMLYSYNLHTFNFISSAFISCLFVIFLILLTTLDSPINNVLVHPDNQDILIITSGERIKPDETATQQKINTLSTWKL